MSTSASSSSPSVLALPAVAVGAAAVAGLAGYFLGQKFQELQNLRKDARSVSMITGQDAEDVKVKDRESMVDVRIKAIRPLLPPACLLEEMPAKGVAIATVNAGRQGVANILKGVDDRLVVVVGPCSIHDTKAALDYAEKLRKAADDLADDLHIIMRVYFEKPRTTVGWKGLINDPDLDGSFNISKGIRVARQLLLDINSMGLPVGTEFLDTISPQFTADVISWGAIGARTTECQLHRELASGLSMPVGFKNGTGGSIQLATDAVISSKHPHCFLSVSTQGLASIVSTKGNDLCHIILRGGSAGPNYAAEHIAKAVELCKKAGACDKIMVDCSHGNSRKLHTNQPLVAGDLAKQIAAGNEHIFGLMIESNLKEGAQKIIPGKPLQYGVSVTDACIDWESTVSVLENLADAVRQRRKILAGAPSKEEVTAASD